MVFSSITFLFVFLPVVLLGYLLLRGTVLRNLFLLAASLFFYYWGEPSFLVVMLASILWNYLGGIACGTAKGKGLRKGCMIVAVVGNLLLLFVYKYLDFGISLINGVFRTSLPLYGIALPIGISFFTFQGLSYVIDVYRGQVPMQKNPLYIALYISMFPQLIAGPIVRYIDVEKQITNRRVTLDKFYEGVLRFTVGLFKKAVIANTLALPADKIFAQDPGALSLPVAWLGAILYTMQIFFDFSGYSDMAIGLGHMFGFTFLENFSYPYIAKSVKEFWRRWHISLSTWFRDYLYIPMGGSRRGNVYLHLIIVFFLTGLWHGASLNFIVWGLWHGAFLLLERVWSKKHTFRNPDNILAQTAQHLYTMLVVVIGWVFFRADDLSYACRYLKTMFIGNSGGTILYDVPYYADGFVLFVLFLAFLISAEAFPRLGQLLTRGSCSGRTWFYITGKNMGIAALLLICAMFVMTSTYNPFIYFRF